MPVKKLRDSQETTDDGGLPPSDDPPSLLAGLWDSL